MLDLVIGYWLSRMVQVAARLGLADRLAKRPRTAADLAREVGAEPDRLYRVMRALASCGVFAEGVRGRFTLTPLGETLRSDHPFSLRAFATMMTEDYNQAAWARLIDGVRGTAVPFELANGLAPFEFYDRHPEHLRVFAEAMSSISATENPAIVSAYDFSRAGRVVDVGGSQGHLLSTILRACPGVRGVLFDRKPVIDRARAAPYLAGELAERVEFVAGDFFTSVPEGDTYVLKYILHDWDDERCVRILRSCRQAMAPRGRILVIDNVIPPGNDPHWGKLLDINMLVVTGGRERTKAEFAALFRSAGLRLVKVHPTACPLSLVEAARARG